MTTEFCVPTLGESVTEATNGRCFKHAGAPVRVDESLVGLETENVPAEASAPAAGVLAAIVAKDGATVTPGALLGQINETAGMAKATPPGHDGAAAKAAPAVATPREPQSAPPAAVAPAAPEK